MKNQQTIDNHIIAPQKMISVVFKNMDIKRLFELKVYNDFQTCQIEMYYLSVRVALKRISVMSPFCFLNFWYELAMRNFDFVFFFAGVYKYRCANVIYKINGVVLM